jgi:hypothetical protein
MRSLGICLILAFTTLGCASEDASAPAQAQPAAAAPKLDAVAFGEPMKLVGQQPQAVGEVLNNLDAHTGKFIRVVGTVDAVCAHKGCWIEIKDQSTAQKLFVHFTCPSEGRLIPMEAAGKKAIVEGTLTVKEISEEDARHIKEEAGAPREEIEKIVGPQKQITLNAPAAQILGL